MIHLFESSICFEQLCAHLQEDNCMNTTSGIITVLVAVLYIGRPLTQSDNTRSCIHTNSSWRWAHSCSKHVEDSNKRIIGETVRQSVTYQNYFFFWGAVTQRESWPPHSWGFLDHTQRRTTVGRTPLDEWSARPRDLYLTTHNTHNSQISLPPWDTNPRSQQATRIN